MKKTLIALAAVAATGAAFAQSSVTISGGYGLALGQTKIGSDNSGMQIARQTGNLQFAGTEDLGGGLKAGFALQTAIGGVATTNTDNSTAANRSILGDRAANVSLAGGFGTVVLGRGNTAIRSLWGAIGDVSQSPVVSGLSAGASTSDANARVILGDTFSNYVAYSTPNMSGFTASVALAPTQQSVAGGATIQTAGNNAATKDTTSMTLQYGNGPLAAAVNITDQAQTGGAKLTTILASYDLGVAKIGLTQQSIDMNAGVNPGDGTALTIAAPMGAGILSAGYGSRKATASAIGDDVKQTHFGYRYNLSKRTHLNLISNKIDRAGTAADVTETHLVVGHTF
jgi:predicted porin